MSRQPPLEVIVAAKVADHLWDIPSSITIAQWALESGWGEHIPPGSNNPFGIKAKAGEPFCTANTHEVIDNTTIPLNARFRVFKSLGEAFSYHAQLLSQSPVYAKARSFLPNIKLFCNALGGGTPEHPSYSTSPTYGAELMAIINESNLERFDS